MYWAVGAKLIQGDDQKLINPQGKATRAEVAAMIMRFQKLLETETPQPEENAPSVTPEA